MNTVMINYTMVETEYWERLIAELLSLNTIQNLPIWEDPIYYNDLKWNAGRLGCSILKEHPLYYEDFQKNNYLNELLGCKNREVHFKT